MNKILKYILWGFVAAMTWGITVTVVMFSITGVCALLTYLHWEQIFFGINGIVGIFAIMFGSLGLGFLFSAKFVYLFIDVIENIEGKVKP